MDKDVDRVVSIDMPVRKTMCPTCPFREGSKHADLAEGITATLMHTSRICHSTGPDNAVKMKTGLPPYTCRGARDIQLRMMCSMGQIESPTDEAWNDSRQLIGMPMIETKDPPRKGK